VEQCTGYGLELWAEAVLEVPFDPSLYQPISMRPPYRQVPVQIFAQEYLRQEFPEVCQPGARPHADSIREIQQSLGDPSVSLLRKYVTMASGMAQAAQRLKPETYFDAGLQARAAYQHATTQSILGDLQLIRVPGNTPQLPPIAEALQTGVAVIAPCGFGKTWVGAHAFAGARVGRYSNHSQELVRGLVVVPSIDRLHEYAEEDDNNIFRQIVGQDIPIGLYYGAEKNIQPITVITEASLRNAIENGILPLQEVGMVLFDEIHHGTSPKNMEALRKLSGAVMGLTATPAYSQMRDIRRHFPHVEVGSLRKFTELGILNSARLLTYRAPEGDAGMEQTAVTLAVQWLRQKRRVVVYAPRSDGQEEHYTDRIAAEINRQLGCEVVGAARSIMGNVAQQTVQDFRKKRLQGLVTVNMVSVGANIEADTLVLCGPQYSEVSFMQKVGRAMRPTDKETILAEIWPHQAPPRQMTTLAMLFGIENFRQGMLIGPETTRQSDAGRPHISSIREKTDTQDAQIELSQLAPMTPQEIRSYYVGPGSELFKYPLPEGCLDSVGVVRRYNSTEEYIQHMLDEASIVYTKRATKAGARRTYCYDSKALTYLDENPPMQVCGETFKTFKETAELLEIPEWLIQQLCTDNDIPREDKLIEQLAQQKCLSDESLNRLMEVLYNLPTADLEKDVSLDSIVEIAGKGFVKEYLKIFDIQPRILRHNPEGAMEGYGYFLTLAQAQEGLALHAVRKQRDGLTSLKDIAAQTGHSLSTLSSGLTDSELAAIVYRKFPGQGPRTLGQYLPDTLSQAVITREKLPPLGPTHIARPALTAVFAAPRHKIINEIGKFSTSDAEYTGRFVGNRTITTYVQWDAVQDAAQQLPLTPAFRNLHLERLLPDRFQASDSNETMTQADLLYARLLQSSLMPWYTQDRWYSAEEAALGVHCVQHVVEVFSRDGARREPGLVRPRRGNMPEIHFKVLVAVFKAVVAAPRVNFNEGWRSHSSVVARVVSKGVDKRFATPPVIGGSRSDIIIAREKHKGHLADIFYDAPLAERVFRRALENHREAERTAQRASRQRM